MFARKIKNRNGSISVQVIRKDHGKYRVVRTVGTSKDPEEIERLWQKAQSLANYSNPHQPTLFALPTPSDQLIQSAIENLSNANLRTIGPELIFGTLFDRIGFNQIPDELFRHLVIARLAYPVSKLKTTDYLCKYKGLTWSVSAVYKFLDRLHSRYKNQAEEIAYRWTEKRRGSVSVVFYDVTSLYFEAEEEDDLRKIGFSKDGKFEHPQILLGLLVAEEGLPIGYDLFEGNTFEGHTLLPILRTIEKKYQFHPPVVVADAAMLSKTVLAELTAIQRQFILGARIKNESASIKQQILEKTVEKKEGETWMFERPDGTNLIVGYSEKRARKDAWNRRRGLLRLQKRIQTGRLTKASINNRGYNKFLMLAGEITGSIDLRKVEEDQRWDGLKGYITNTQLDAKTVIENYSHLWKIEKAFRISKTDLRIRPIYHYRKRRIEAHVCIAFVAYAIYMELEMLLKQKTIALSAKRAGELTQRMYELHYTLPDSREKKRFILNMDSEQLSLYNAVFEI